FFQAEDGIRDATVTGVQTCALPILDDLDGVDEPGAHGADAVRGFPAVEAETNGADLSAAAQFFDGGQDPLITEPGVFPGVQLNEIGRASCRERGENWVVAETIKIKK